jgi:hypothetical protein
MSLRRQAPGLDCVREDHARAVFDGVGLTVGVEQISEVVAAKIAYSGAQLGVVELAHDPLDICSRAPFAGQPLAQLGGRAAQQALVLVVWHLIDALAQRFAAALLKERAKATAVLDGDRLPAGGIKHRADTPGSNLGHDAVERLAVDVDDPQHLAEPRDERVEQRFPDGALVKLGVADERDMTTALRHVEVPGYVAMRERAPDRRGSANPDGAG